MIYILGATSLVASATELVIAFVMGLAGSINWAMHGMVDIRLTLIILAGSLMGVQLGAIGTTFVREHMIKIVMGSIMLIVAVSRGLAIPKYLAKLGLMGPERLHGSPAGQDQLRFHGGFPVGGRRHHPGQHDHGQARRACSADAGSLTVCSNKRSGALDQRGQTRAYNTTRFGFDLFQAFSARL